MAKNNKKQSEEQFGKVEKTVVESESFIEKHSKIVGGIVLGILIIIVAILIVKKYYLEPKQNKAQAEVFMAQKAFGDHNYDLALNGDGNHMGFLEVQKKYSTTKAGKMANYYIGISYLNTAEYDKAISYLKKFKSKDHYVYGMSRAAIADAYVEKGDLKTAADYYRKAADIKPNEITTPEFLKKLAITFELLGDNNKAIKAYKEILDKFPTSTSKHEIERELARLQAIEK